MKFMNKTRWALLALITAAAAGGWWWKNTTSERAMGAGTSAAVGAAAGAGAGAGGAKGSGKGSAGAGGGPVSVVTAPVVQRDIAIELDAVGTVSPLNAVEVRPQVGNVIRQVLVKEGQFVGKGQALFVLDSSTEQANVAKANAQLQKDSATLADYQRQYQRSKELLAKQFVSKAAVETSMAQMQAQAAVVASDKAALDAAKVPLNATQVRAPAGGRVGAINVYAGSSTQANATPLLTITQMDPIAVSFNVPQRSLADVLAALRTGTGVVNALSADKSKGALQGKLSFIDSSVDANTGTVKAKAVFANAQQTLWPGAFVNLKITTSVLKDALVVPQTAIMQDLNQRNVYVLGADKKVTLKPVTLVYASGDAAAVTGLQAGEKVVTVGKQNLRPGGKAFERGAQGAVNPNANANASGNTKASENAPAKSGSKSE